MLSFELKIKDCICHFDIGHILLCVVRDSNSADKRVDAETLYNSLNLQMVCVIECSEINIEGVF